MLKYISILLRMLSRENNVIHVQMLYKPVTSMNYFDFNRNKSNLLFELIVSNKWKCMSLQNQLTLMFSLCFLYREIDCPIIKLLTFPNLMAF